jgi:hypothetical protein
LGHSFVGLLDELPDLEMYFPVDEHRANWTAEARVTVAFQLADGDDVIAFDSEGAERILDGSEPPEGPTLVLVPNETRRLVSMTENPAAFVATGNLMNSEGDCDPETALEPCDDPPSGGGGGPDDIPDFTVPTGVPTGFYFGQMRVFDAGESWPRGDPELEVHISGIQRGVWVSSPGPGFPGPFGEPQTQLYFDSTAIRSPIWTGCAGENANPAIRSFDFNGEGGEENVQNVLVVEADDFAQTERVLVPGVGPVREFSVEAPYDVWIIERDDGGACPAAPTKYDDSFSVDVNLSTGHLGFNPSNPIELIQDLLGSGNEIISQWRFLSFADFEVTSIEFLDHDNAVGGQKSADLWVFSAGLTESQLAPEQILIN